MPLPNPNKLNYFLREYINYRWALWHRLDQKVLEAAKTIIKSIVGFFKKFVSQPAHKDSSDSNRPPNRVNQYQMLFERFNGIKMVSEEADSASIREVIEQWLEVADYLGLLATDAEKQLTISYQSEAAKVLHALRTYIIASIRETPTFDAVYQAIIQEHRTQLEKIEKKLSIQINQGAANDDSKEKRNNLIYKLNNWQDETTLTKSAADIYNLFPPGSAATDTTVANIKKVNTKFPLYYNDRYFDIYFRTEIYPDPNRRAFYITEDKFVENVALMISLLDNQLFAPDDDIILQIEAKTRATAVQAEVKATRTSTTPTEVLSKNTTPSPINDEARSSNEGIKEPKPVSALPSSQGMFATPTRHSDKAVTTESAVKPSPPLEIKQNTALWPL